MTTAFRTKRLLELAAARGHNNNAAIAAHLGIDEGSISRYLAGKRQPDPARLLHIARAYDADMESLISSDDSEDVA